MFESEPESDPDFLLPPTLATPKTSKTNQVNWCLQAGPLLVVIVVTTPVSGFYNPTYKRQGPILWNSKQPVLNWMMKTTISPRKGLESSNWKNYSNSTRDAD